MGAVSTPVGRLEATERWGLGVWLLCLSLLPKPSQTQWVLERHGLWPPTSRASNPSSAPFWLCNLEQVNHQEPLGASVSLSVKKWLMAKVMSTKYQRLKLTADAHYNHFSRCSLNTCEQLRPPQPPGSPGGVLTLGISPVWGLFWQLLDVILE